MPVNAPYKKIGDIAVSSVEQVINKIQSFDSYFDYKITIDSILSNLAFGVSANKFERSLQELGSYLGFDSLRPDKQYKSGPDNLWRYSTNHYLVFECKSEKIQSSVEITKDEAAQMGMHYGWFRTHYGKDEVVKYIFVHPMVNLSKLADIPFDVYSLNREALERLKDNVRGFVQEFERTAFSSITQDQVISALKAHKLDIKSLEGDTYIKKCYK